jgi:general secretion pathway protein G
MSVSVNKRLHRQAFTLIELLLVLVILGVLAAVVVPKFVGRGEQAREAAAKTDIANIESAIDRFEVDNGRFPSNDEGLGVLVNPPMNATNWRGPYLKSVPNDPWQGAYIYRYPGTHNVRGFDLLSMGPDGREGNDDIMNWTEQAQ